MTPEFVLTIAQQAIKIALMLTSIILLPALVVGIIVSMFQAATQINEQTLTFIPKLIVTFLTIMIAGPFMLRLVTEYTANMIQSIPNVIF